MRTTLLTASVVAVSVTVGLLAATGLPMEEINSLQNSLQSDQTENNQSEQSRTLELGSAHEHALFWIVENGTEKDLTSQKFQLNSRYVHLENNKSQIVHKHAEGVTWRDYLNTINTTVNNTGENEVCFSVFGNRSCGEGGAYLNGKRLESFDQEIRQGDNFLIILGTEEWRQRAARYMQEQLPPNYKPEQSRGKRV